MTVRPFFSIIMPVYNRERFIARAIDSCLSQDFKDFEIVVADDGSTDSSRHVIESYEDPRVRLVGLDRNVGRCPARNRAMSSAHGVWFVFLDSDDELVPGALRTMYQRIRTAAESVGALRFMCQTSDGVTSPDPPHEGSVLGYDDFLKWMERSMAGKSQEALPCVRADTFPAIQYPQGHAEEALYHLDVARAVDVKLLQDVVRIYHHDAPNQVTRMHADKWLRWASSSADAHSRLLSRHGASLQRSAPKLAAIFQRQGATWEFLNGNRAAGLTYAKAYFKTTGDLYKIAPVVLLGLVSPSLLAWGKSLRWKGN
jgi:glycosyltransferase involved in cell wall biosynthesis